MSPREFAAGYALVVTGLWCAVIPAAGLLPGGDGVLLEIGLACAIFAVPIGLLVSPGLAVIGSIAAIAASMVLWRDPWVTGTATLISACLVRLSLARARDALARLKRRIAMDWHAQRASRFIEEFEQAGRGWFWETSPRGDLSYVSDQLAADLDTAARKLIGKPFGDLIGTDDSGSAESSERTLGFHLSARLPFTDITVRANASAEIWWSLSGTPSFDEYGRFLGFRGIGTDLTEQRRSAEEINRLAKYNSLTGLPNRALMRRTLDETLENKGSDGCALFLIDLDRFKNVNDTLGHPVGDALLKQVAQRLAIVIGKKGQIGRLGGDEFKAVLPGPDEGNRAGRPRRPAHPAGLDALSDRRAITSRSALRSASRWRRARVPAATP